MVFDISIALTWVLFLALFPIAFFWLRRAWRIIIKRDFSEVALKRGVPPPNPEKFASLYGILNLVAGVVIVCVIVSVVTAAASYDEWSAVAGITLWCKFFLDFGLSRHAHALGGKKAEAQRAPNAQA